MPWGTSLLQRRLHNTGDHRQLWRVWDQVSARGRLLRRHLHRTEYSHELRRMWAYMPGGTSLLRWCLHNAGHHCQLRRVRHQVRVRGRLLRRYLYPTEYTDQLWSVRERMQGVVVGRSSDRQDRARGTSGLLFRRYMRLPAWHYSLWNQCLLPAGFLLRRRRTKHLPALSDVGDRLGSYHPAK